jgi:hypothetical protein
MDAFIHEHFQNIHVKRAHINSYHILKLILHYFKTNKSTWCYFHFRYDYKKLNKLNQRLVTTDMNDPQLQVKKRSEPDGDFRNK